MKIIIGLGNPGKNYEFTRHNAGFLLIDYLAEEYDIKINKIKHKALIGEGFIEREKVILVKPQTFMNLSGESVRELIKFYKADISEILIIYDDISLELGRLRIRSKGTDGGHNGIKSIIYQLQDDSFPRVKVGVGAPRHKNHDLVDFVLGSFSKEELLVLKEIAKINVDIVKTFIKEDINSCMNKFNSTNLLKGDENND